ncbi:hypothetical protein AGMMS49944_16430 [Spirochaetia bacterium]|nr:hypothetical protein AGMMS49944_16430 [Spirochaetia bacterium]
MNTETFEKIYEATQELDAPLQSVEDGLPVRESNALLREANNVVYKFPKYALYDEKLLSTKNNDNEEIDLTASILKNTKIYATPKEAAEVQLNRTNTAFRHSIILGCDEKGIIASIALPNTQIQPTKGNFAKIALNLEKDAIDAIFARDDERMAFINILDQEGVYWARAYRNFL